MDAPDRLLAIFFGVMAWLFVTLYLAILRQRERSPLRTMLSVVASLILAVALGLVSYTVW